MRSGWASAVTRLPDRDRPDLLARLTLSPADPSRHAQELVDAIDKRCTDRRRFTSWPVPDERLTHLAAPATAWGARALPLTDVSERFHAEILINRAMDVQARRLRRHERAAGLGGARSRRRRAQGGAAGAGRAGRYGDPAGSGPGCSTTSEAVRSRARTA